MLSHRSRQPELVVPQHEIIGTSQVIVELLSNIRRLAHTSAKVLITGETGVGKELVASYIHAWSRRASSPFVAVNCAGLPETLLESELFGHVKGSFTGAYRDKAGKFEQAHTGTLFLDEVGEMSPRMQGLLLRVAERGEIEKVGTDQATTRVDCRMVAATNRDLQAMAAQNLFREDLYYRLNVMRVHVPPLRERPEDIPLLADYFLHRYSEPDRPQTMSPDAYAALQAYTWPGNVRQLENVVHRIAINTPHPIIGWGDLPADIAGETHVVPAAPPRDRRRAVADALYERLEKGADFWATVFEPYTDRQITRTDLRMLVERGISEASGSYRQLTRKFNVAPQDYRRFLSFLRRQRCLLPFRSFR